MVTTFSRRAVLQMTGGLGSSTLAGCSSLSSELSMLTLTLFNHAESPYTVEMGLLQSGGDKSRSDARVYGRSIDVAPQGETQREDVAEVKPYLVRYNVYENNSRQTDEDHVHYYPTDGRSSDSLTFDISSTGVLTRR